MPAPPRIKYTQEKEWLCMSEQEMTKADNRQRYIELGYNIAYYRKHAGLTQEQLSEVLGVTVGAVYKWEARLSQPELSPDVFQHLHG